jgi:hypothetical protein
MDSPMKWFLPLLWCVCLCGADVPRLYYTKSFPGSQPPFVAVSLDKTGAGEYKEAENDDRPIRFQLSPSDVSGIFALVEKLGYFNHPLESQLKVAFMGTKTFRFVDGATNNEVKFNFSEDPDARELADWFERISESEQQLVSLEVSAKYEKLGVMQSLLQLETFYDRKRLVDPQQYLPLLDRIANNESYLHQARQRAANLAAEIRTAK